MTVHDGKGCWRKPLILIGYALGALSKPFFALASVPMVVFAARFADRIGKGLRGAPRDALVADVTPEAIRGRAYGVRQALDTAGAFIGPLVAIMLMALFANDMRAVFWFAIIPGALAVLCVVLGVEDRTVGSDESRARPPIRLADLRRLDRAFWGVVAIGVVFTLARFSEAFLVLKASAEGLPAARARAARAGRDEHRLLARRLSSRRLVGQGCANDAVTEENPEVSMRILTGSLCRTYQNSIRSARFLVSERKLVR